MKKIIKRVLLVLILAIGFAFIINIKENKTDDYQVKETINNIEFPKVFEPKVKTDDYDILKSNVEKRAYKDDNAKWLLENFDSLDSIEQILIGNDSDTMEFVYNYENSITDFLYEEGESKKYGRSTPYYIQWDDRWAYKPLGNNNIGFAGCGPTSMAMVLSRLENDPSITPLTIADHAHNYMTDNGISWKFFTDEAYRYNRSIDNIPLDEEYMVNALEKGPLIVSVGPGYFTMYGHILVIDSYSNGKFVINDPNSLKNSERKWLYEDIKDQILNIWLIY